MSQETSSPAVAKTFGIIHLVYFGLFLLLSVYGVYSLYFASGAPQSDPVSQEMASIQRELITIPSVKVYFLISQVVGFALLAVLLVAGLQLLKRQPLGRMLSLVFAWASIVTGILSTVLYMLLVQPTYKELLAGSSLDENVLKGVQMMSNAQPFLMFCCSALYPIIILIFLLPEKFARSLAPAPATEVAPPDGPPAEPPAPTQE
jgi:hypothetical protein